MPKEESTRQGLKEKIATWIQRARELLTKIYHGEKFANRILQKFVNGIKVFIVSAYRFKMDDCLTRASSIAYTVIVTLIPTLTVILTFYSIFAGAKGKKEELFAKISNFMLEHNIKLNVDPIISAISGLIDNAAQIGVIGAVITIFSATAILRSMENSFNHIWKVQKSRPLHLRIVYYWAALTLGPILLTAGTTVASQLTEIFAAPNYNAIHVDREAWIVGNKANILRSKKADLDFKKLSTDAIDFNNQHVYAYDDQSKSFKEQEVRVELIDFRKHRLNHVFFLGQRGWITGDDGLILSTTDGGDTWDIRKFGTFNFNRIHMMTPERGFMASDNGIVLSTQDGGRNWEVSEWEGVSSSFYSIGFYKNTGIIAGSGGTILRTADAGKTWDVQQLGAAKRKDRFVSLNSVFFVDERNAWIAGDEGVMLRTADGGKTWKAVRYQDNNYHAAFFSSPAEGFVAGGRGVVIHTRNGGESWRISELPSYRVNSLVCRGKNIWAVGDTGMIMISSDAGRTWKGSEGNNFLLLLANFFAPFVFIWLLFLAAYISIPNTRVPFKQAAIGAAFTGAIWVVFILLFIVYVKSFARGTFAVYGALAAIPLFLLMVYASSLIILYGAEVAYTLMHPELYRTLHRLFRKKMNIYVYNGVALLHQVYAKFESGKGPSTLKELSRFVSDTEEMEFYLEMFLAAGLVIQKGEEEYLPGKGSDKVMISDVIQMVQTTSLAIPDSVKASPVRTYMNKLLGEIEASGRKVTANLNLRELIARSKG